MVAVFGLSSVDGRDTELAARCACVLLRRAPHAGVGIHSGLVHTHPDGSIVKDERWTALLAVSDSAPIVRP